MNDDHLSAPWQKVGQMLYIELADALSRRAWSEARDMTTPEAVEAIRRHDWTVVGDELQGMENAHAIRDAMKVGTEDDVLDASMSDDREARLSRIGVEQNKARIQADYDAIDRGARVGMPP